MENIYNIRARSISNQGFESNWFYLGGGTASIDYTVGGQTEPPPDVQGFRYEQLANFDRFWTWLTANAPRDVITNGGVEIRWTTDTALAQNETTWESMTVLETIGFSRSYVTSLLKRRQLFICDQIY